MDRIAEMELFAAIAEHGSFSEAARRTGVAKSVVSKHVRALEDRLGVRLINRTTRRLSLTEVGLAYHERCVRILAELEDADLSASRMQIEPRGRLRVNAPMSFGQHHLAPILPDFLSAHPAITVELTLNDRYVDVVEEGYDLALRIGKLEDSSLIARRLSAMRSILCASSAYLAVHGRPCHPRDLAGHNCLSYAYLATGDEWALFGPGGAVTVRARGNLQVNNGDALCAATVAGLGIAVLPDFIAADSLRTGRLERVLPGWERPPSAVHAIYPHSRHLSTRLRVFVDFLAERFGGDPPWGDLP